VIFSSNTFKAASFYFIITLIFFSECIIKDRVFLPLDIYDQGRYYPPRLKEIHAVIKGDPVLVLYPNDTL